MATPMIDPEDLTETDGEILAMLREGRVTAPFVADETGKSLEYVRSRLIRLKDHNHVKRVYDGLYELTDDPENE